MLVKRSGESTSKQRSDKGSLVLLWVTITLCLTMGFIFANYRLWKPLNHLVAFIGLFIVVVGFLVRWISILQLKKAFTVDVAIGKEHELKIDGLYKYLRHPSYLGLLLIMTGFSICMNSFVSVMVVVIPMFLVLQYRISVEESLLIKAFGDRYIAYKATTSKLFPFPHWNNKNEPNNEAHIITNKPSGDSSKQGRFVVSVFDGFDNEWFEICEPTTYENAKRLYNEKTNNGTINTNFRDSIDYYGIFEADE